MAPPALQAATADLIQQGVAVEVATTTVVVIVAVISAIVAEGLRERDPPVRG